MELLTELPNTLKQLFGIVVPVVQASETQTVDTTCIFHIAHKGVGDIWSGFSYQYEIILNNFIRPDNGQALLFRLSYVVHDLSAQLDEWNAEARGIEDSEYLVFLNLLHIKNIDFYPSNHLKTNVYINEKKVKMLGNDG